METLGEFFSVILEETYLVTKKINNSDKGFH